MRKLRFFLMGFIPGLIIVFFILNQKGAKCSGYLPESRVIAETLSKKNFHYSDEAKNAMQKMQIDEKFLKDSIITKGSVDFGKSHAQEEPCPDYFLTYPKKNPRLQITFEKCKESVKVLSLRKVN
ncbi:hypothetical protein [Cruoricaptor ignavus]|nr:hypothetical protein [Cruoricaptor ignavus]